MTLRVRLGAHGLDRAYSNCLPELTFPEWEAVLNLATMWEMDNLRSAIVSKLSAMSPVLDPAQQIRLALKFSIRSWIPRAMETFICRSEIPSLQEVQTMGVDMAMQIWSMRERNRSRIVDKVRNNAHERLYEAWVVHCKCNGCNYGREVALDRESGAPGIDYAEFDACVRQEVQLMDVSDIPLSLG
jgi:hypothetical protein